MGYRQKCNAISGGARSGGGQMTHVRNGRFYGLLALAGLVWGLQPLFVKFVVAELTPTTLTALRVQLHHPAAVRPCRPARHSAPAPAGLPAPARLHGADGRSLQQYRPVFRPAIFQRRPTPPSSGPPRRLPRRCSRPSSCGKSFCPSSGWASASRCWGTLFLVTHGSLDMLLSISFNRGDPAVFLPVSRGGPSIPSSGCGAWPACRR